VPLHKALPVVEFLPTPSPGRLPKDGFGFFILRFPVPNPHSVPVPVVG